MRESRSSGSVGGEDGNILAYPAGNRLAFAHRRDYRPIRIDSRFGFTVGTASTLLLPSLESALRATSSLLSDFVGLNCAGKFGEAFDN